MRNDLVRRNPREGHFSLVRYHPSNPTFLVRDLNRIDDLEFWAEYPDARGYVSPMLPGYSLDGLTACLFFRFGPTPHGALGCYLLRRVKGRWEVVWRNLRDFPRTAAQSGSDSR
jgi:hypothetical protein